MGQARVNTVKVITSGQQHPCSWEGGNGVAVAAAGVTLRATLTDDEEICTVRFGDGAIQAGGV